jgi:argininosuccinate lyase
MFDKSHVEEIDGISFPGKTFAECVLKPIFNTQKKYYYKPFIKISRAHAIMLNEQNIITDEEVAKLLTGLSKVDKIDFEKSNYDPRYEDMFFMVEKELSELVGVDVAGRLHIARSRNDLDICEFRMVLREMFLQLTDVLNDFKEVLLNIINENIDTIMPAYTHTQPAQPTTLAHYMLAFYDVINRSYYRLLKAYDGVNLSPIGAAAITTTGFPINRDRMAELLGFDGLVENSYDSIAGVDYLTESAAALMIMNTDLSKLIKDTLDFCTKEFNVYYLTNPYVQISSIMPQKRNPSSLEHTRPMTSNAIAEAKCIFDILHNTPFGDIVDSEEQLQPHIYSSIEFTMKVLKILSSVYTTLKINKKVLFDRAHESFITATELADTLVREKGLSFRESHKITADLIKKLTIEHLDYKDITSEMINQISSKVIGERVNISIEDIKTALDPVNFVNIRTITGGPAPSETIRMLNARKEKFKSEINEIKTKKDNLLKADTDLDYAVEVIVSNYKVRV